MVRWVLGSLGVLFAGFGCVATLARAGILDADNALTFYTIILPTRLLNLPNKSILTDAAHGPPFLTFTGVFVVYFLPATVLLLWSSRSLSQAANGKQP